MPRRRTVMIASAAFLAAGMAAPLRAADLPKVFHIGYQKTGLLTVARNQRSIETALAKQGIAVEWVEFSSGPPLLEAMNVGSLDLGLTGDTPPIFAQAAGAAITYVAALPPNGAGEAIIVKSASPIHGLGDLAGKRIGFKVGSSANNLLVAALEKAGVAWTAIRPVDLSPADAAAAFAGGDIDAWSIWDPYFAVAEEREEVRVLVTSADILHANTFLIANRTFARTYPRLVQDVISALGQTAAWAQAHPDDVAQAVHEVTRVDLPALQKALGRTSFYVHPIDDKVVENQQATADRFYKLHLIPKPIQIRDAVWTPPQS